MYRVMSDIFDQLVEPAEGFRLTVYDDADGKPIIPGKLVKGHATIGIGRALDTHGISQAEAQYLYQNDKEAVYSALQHSLDWFGSLDDTRQAVLASMAFQLGIAGLLAFKTTLSLIHAGDYAGAAAAMLQSKWATQTPSRAKMLANTMQYGTIPLIMG